MMRKILLIDANNMAFRVHWTHKHLKLGDMPVSLLYGFFRSLISLRKKFPDYFPLIAWDGGYARRKVESETAVESGLIPSSYKANRRRAPEEEMDPIIESLLEQMPPLQEALKLARVLQVRVGGVEADDVVNTYVMDHRDTAEHIIMVTSDKDYYQLLSYNVCV